jgi:hypothetical protein
VRLALRLRFLVAHRRHERPGADFIN